MSERATETNVIFFKFKTYSPLSQNKRVILFETRASPIFDLKFHLLIYFFGWPTDPKLNRWAAKTVSNYQLKERIAFEKLIAQARVSPSAEVGWLASQPKRLNSPITDRSAFRSPRLNIRFWVTGLFVQRPALHSLPRSNSCPCMQPNRSNRSDLPENKKEAVGKSDFHTASAYRSFT
jgi:hypothetical protein